MAELLRALGIAGSAFLAFLIGAVVITVFWPSRESAVDRRVGLGLLALVCVLAGLLLASSQ